MQDLLSEPLVTPLFSLDFLMSQKRDNSWVRLFIQPLFCPSTRSLNCEEMCFTRHAHGVLSCPSAYPLPIETPLILQYL